MKIGFIGAGKVGFSLGKHAAVHGASISGYSSRSVKSAEDAAAFAGGEAFGTPDALVQASDIVFITVPDGHIASTWNAIAQSVREGKIDLAGKTICHCSGALSSNVFEGAADFGAFAFSVHPLYAVSSKYETYRELGNALFTVEGTPERLDQMVELVRSWGNEVQAISAQDKVRYHAAAVMASNLVVGLVHAAAGELERCGFTPDSAERALRPLFLGNAEHIAEDGTAAALTGPAERGDSATIAKHLDCLDGTHREIYRLLTEELYEVAAIKHGDSRK
ncbi:MAG: DUF2520 domain-containing protein [Coriobacteriia bacterium]|nr:DUF2520 domain-containing protein [Coriobacteriia bacterium]